MKKKGEKKEEERKERERKEQGRKEEIVIISLPLSLTRLLAA